MSVTLTSASGILSLLEEDKYELKTFALEKLNGIVDDFWAEISEIIDKIEVLYEDEQFNNRKLASLVASKVYYHLGSFEGEFFVLFKCRICATSSVLSNGSN